MKISPDGQYLASGGEDGVVRIWRVTTTCTSCKRMCIESDNQGRNGKSGSGLKKLSQTSVVIPDTDFQMEELPVQELHGHTSDILDLAWSNSNVSHLPTFSTSHFVHKSILFSFSISILLVINLNILYIFAVSSFLIQR